MNNCANDNALEEYKILRSEIELKMQLTNTLAMAMVTAVTGCIIAGFQFEHRIFFFLCICIILPLSERIRYYKDGITRISEYMIVFLEDDAGIRWESRNQKAQADRLRSRFVFRDSIFLYIASVVSWCTYSYIKKSLFLCRNWFYIIGYVLSVIFYVCRLFKNKHKITWYEVWTKVKKEA